MTWDSSHGLQIFAYMTVVLLRVRAKLMPLSMPRITIHTLKNVQSYEGHSLNLPNIMICFIERLEAFQSGRLELSRCWAAGGRETPLIKRGLAHDCKKNSKKFKKVSPKKRQKNKSFKNLS